MLEKACHLLCHTTPDNYCSGCHTVEPTVTFILGIVVGVVITLIYFKLRRDAAFTFLLVVSKAAPQQFMLSMLGIIAIISVLFVGYLIQSYRKEHEPIDVVIKNLQKDLIKAYPELNGNIDVTADNLIFKRFENDYVFQVNTNNGRMVATYCNGLTGWYPSQLFDEMVAREKSPYRREVERKILQQQIRTELEDELGVMRT